MAAGNTDVRSVFLTIRFGAIPSYEMRADKALQATPREAKYIRSGDGDEFADLLKQVLNKINSSYGKDRSITINVDDDGNILPD